METERKQERRHYVFRGEVQGVGFRYRMYYAARSCGLAGWVKNEWDGSVVAELEGEPRMIDEAVMQVAQGRFVDITDTEVRMIPLCGEHGFEIVG